MSAPWEAFSLPALLGLFTIALFAALLLASTRKAWYGLLAMLPWTLAWPNPDQPGAALASLTLEVPLEPAMLLLLAVLLMRAPTRARVVALLGRPWHPVLLTLAAFFVWLTVTSAASAHWLVGAKELAILGLVCACFFVAPLALVTPRSASAGTRRNPPNLVSRSGLVLACSLVPLVLYTAMNRSAVGPYLASDPWFRSHIEYGQVLAITMILLLPALLIGPEAGTGSSSSRLRKAAALNPIPILIGFLALALGSGIFLARSRAALLLLLVALPAFLLAIRRPSPKRATTTLALVFLLLSGTLGYLVQVRNTHRSAAPSRDITAPLPGAVAWMHQQTFFTDESMTERFNRWDTAVAIARQRPLIGVGPGSFEQTYSRFQDPKLATRFSTTLGDLGDAHSHYLEALAEQGVIGMILSLLLFLVPVATGFHNAKLARSRIELFSAAATTAALCGLMASSLFSTFLALQELAPLYFLLAALVLGPSLSRDSPRRGTL